MVLVVFGKCKVWRWQCWKRFSNKIAVKVTESQLILCSASRILEAGCWNLEADVGVGTCR